MKAAGEPSLARDADTSWCTRVLSDAAEIEQLRSDWMRCRSNLPRPDVQLHPDWLPIACRPGAAGNPTPAVATLMSGTEVVGVAPFRLLNYRWVCRLAYRELLAFRIRLADLCGESLAAPDVERAHVLLLTALIDRGIPFDMLFLESIDKRSRLWQTLLESRALRRAFWIYVPDPEAIHHLIHLPDTLDLYVSGLTSEKQRKLRRLDRAASDTGSGPIELQRVDRAEQIPEFLRRAEHVALRSWKASALGKVLRATEEEVARLTAYADRGWLRSYLLLRGGAPIAFRTCYQSDGVLYLDETGYDAALRSLQPGKLLLYLMIRDCYEADTPQWVDFGYGDNDHKRFFANDSYSEANVYLVRKTLRPSVAMVAQLAVAISGRLARRALDRLSVRHRVRGWLRRQQNVEKAPAPPDSSGPC